MVSFVDACVARLRHVLVKHVLFMVIGANLVKIGLFIFLPDTDIDAKLTVGVENDVIFGRGKSERSERFSGECIKLSANLLAWFMSLVLLILSLCWLLPLLPLLLI